MKYDYDQNTQILLESIISHIDKNKELVNMAKFSDIPHANAIANTITSSDYVKNSEAINAGLERLISKAQSTNISDKFTNWFGWFDHEIPELNAKRSELLAKKDVQNYTYTRHYWAYQDISWFWNNVISCINGILNITSYVTDPKVNEQLDGKLLDKEVDTYYSEVINPYIDQHLFGKKKNAARDRLIGMLVGNGLTEATKKMNFKDDITISAMLDMAESLHDFNLKGESKITEGEIKDIKAQIDGIMAKFNSTVKNSVRDPKIAAKWLKVGIQYIAIMMDKLYEWNNAEYYSLNIIGSEILKVLKGLLKYQGK